MGRGDPCEIWPDGLAITGDLEEDLMRWEAAELQATKAYHLLDEESFTSDSDDAIPLPVARARPSNVPRLVLNGTGDHTRQIEASAITVHPCQNLDCFSSICCSCVSCNFINHCLMSAQDPCHIGQCASSAPSNFVLIKMLGSCLFHCIKQCLVAE